MGKMMNNDRNFKQQNLILEYFFGEIWRHWETIFGFM